MSEELFIRLAAIGSIGMIVAAAAFAVIRSQGL
jgi:hypothetical protein